MSYSTIGHPQIQYDKALFSDMPLYSGSDFSINNYLPSIHDTPVAKSGHMTENPDAVNPQRKRLLIGKKTRYNRGYF